MLKVASAIFAAAAASEAIIAAAEWMASSAKWPQSVNGHKSCSMRRGCELFAEGCYMKWYVSKARACKYCSDTRSCLLLHAAKRIRKAMEEAVSEV